MFTLAKDEVSKEAIEKGRGIAEVLRKYQQYYAGAETVADLVDVGADQTERMTACAAWRLYLLGFEDALNAGKKG